MEDRPIASASHDAHISKYSASIQAGTYAKEPTKFVASYSGGKDSALAVWKAIQSGMELAALLVTYNTERGCSWFHGMDDDMLAELGAVTGVRVILVKTDSTHYAENVKKALSELRQEGVSVCVFGDIDIEGHRCWGEELCAKAGMQACFPLWQQPRVSLVLEGIACGCKSLITVVDTKRMNESYCGRLLNKECVDNLRADGVDPCGESGEFHSFVFDAPFFSRAITVATQEPIMHEDFAICPLICEAKRN